MFVFANQKKNITKLNCCEHSENTKMAHRTHFHFIKVRREGESHQDVEGEDFWVNEVQEHAETYPLNLKDAFDSSGIRNWHIVSFHSDEYFDAPTPETPIFVLGGWIRFETIEECPATILQPSQKSTETSGKPPNRHGKDRVTQHGQFLKQAEIKGCVPCSKDALCATMSCDRCSYVVCRKCGCARMDLKSACSLPEKHVFSHVTAKGVSVFKTAEKSKDETSSQMESKRDAQTTSVARGCAGKSPDPELVEELEQVKAGTVTEKLFWYLKRRMSELPQYTHLDQYWIRAAEAFRLDYLNECREGFENPSFDEKSIALPVLTARQWEQATSRWNTIHDSKAPCDVASRIKVLETIFQGRIPRDLYEYIQRKMSPQSRTIDSNWLIVASAYREGFIAKQVEFLHDQGARNLSHFLSAVMSPITLKQWKAAQTEYQTSNDDKCSCGRFLTLADSKQTGSCLSCRKNKSNPSNQDKLPGNRFTNAATRVDSELCPSCSSTLSSSSGENNLRIKRCNWCGYTESRWFDATNKTTETVSRFCGSCSNCRCEFSSEGTKRIHCCPRCGSNLVWGCALSDQKKILCACGNELLLPQSVESGACWECRLVEIEEGSSFDPFVNSDQQALQTSKRSDFTQKQDSLTFWSDLVETSTWDPSDAIARYVNDQLDNSDETRDVDEIVAEFLSWPEDLQREWFAERSRKTFGGNGPSKKVTFPETTQVFKKVVSRDYYESVQMLLSFAESPTSKFLDLVASQVFALQKLDPENPHLHRLLKAICWTGTQPGAPFDPNSQVILKEWLQELRLE